MRVAVIGCGLIGAAAARELALRGVQTVVYEQCRPCHGTSGTTFAWVNSHDKEPRAYHDLNVAGIRAHHELHGRGVHDSQWFFPTGSLAWAEGADDATRLRRIHARLESWGYSIRELTQSEARGLEPDLQLSPRVDQVLFFPDEGYVLPTILLARLLGEALDRGAELRCPVRVDAIDVVPEGVRLKLADGSADKVDVAVSCVGRWTAGLMATAGYSLPMADPDAPGSPTVGYLAFTCPTPARLGRVVRSPRLNVRPDGGKRFVLQGLDLDLSADPAASIDADDPIARELISRLGRTLRGAEGVAIDAIRVGQRAMPADGVSAVGHLDERGRLYAIATHSGVTLAPLLGAIAAAEIADDTQSDDLVPFRPQRFAPTAQ